MQNLAYYLLFSVVLVSGLFIHHLSAFAHPPSWAPAHGHREKHHKHKHKHKHDYYHHDHHADYSPRYKEKVVEKVYYYYPAQQVYYSPQNQQYFWLQAGNWTLGYQLPNAFQVGNSVPVTLNLNTDRPYTEHRWIKQKYSKI